MQAFLETEQMSPLCNWGVALPALWLLLQEERLSAQDVGLLRNLFPGYSCHVWSISDGGAASAAVKKLKRAFGNWPALQKCTVAKTDMVCGDVLFYCDVARAESESDVTVAELARSTLWGKSSGLFMSSKPVERFPEDLLSLCRIGLERSGQDQRAEREQVLKRHLEFSAEEGTIPLLVGEDSNSNQFLIAPGQYDTHSGLLEIVTPREFNAWVDKGIDLRILT